MKPKTMIEHLPLILGICLPIAFMLVVLLVSYVPTLGIRPAHDFLYVQLNEPYGVQYRHEYRIEQGKLALIPVEIGPDEYRTVKDRPKLYRYSVTTNTSTEVSPEEAQQLALVPGPSSPDGYVVRYQYGGGTLLFDRGEAHGYYITKGGAGKRLTAINTQGMWGGQQEIVVGWIK